MATRPAEKTSFALACGLLSQYMKEKGNTLNLNLGVSEAYQRPTTMRFLPGAEVETETEMEDTGNAFISVSSKNEIELFPQSAGFEASNPSENKQRKEAEKSQLTIFYGGRVLVFDNYPVDKVEELKNFASTGRSTSCNSTYMPPTSSYSQISVTDKSTVPSTTIPLARAQIPRAAIKQFMEKRKDRLNAKAPYQQVSPNKKEIAASNKKKDIEVSWLGLGPQV
ncbi:protein TIFY 10A-like protein [Carex littledalei]|uniref:Protein TIFY n=1 Tax=Carex littledalei TaxID=544730 RepID=A0A833QXD8_9POAL|nr:protein TIFY 10A-like protein [Carex littledalei]